jgi:hypothetical protein
MKNNEESKCIYNKFNLDMDKSSFVKSMNDSKILKKRQNKNESIFNNKPMDPNINEDYSMDKINFKNENENLDFKKNLTKRVDKLNSIKDISGITHKDNYYIKDHINNSIFQLNNMSSENFNQDNEDLDRLKSLRLDNNNTTPRDGNKKNNENSKILGDFYFNVSGFFYI